MAKKKKKMTPAQAAAARRDDRPKRKPLPDSVKDEGPRDSNSRMVIVVAVVSMLAAAVLGVVFALPGITGQ